ncbi:hypothetical protein DV515_00015276, partial [Chloebia gouldiae]
PKGDGKERRNANRLLSLEWTRNITKSCFPRIAGTLRRTDLVQESCWGTSTRDKEPGFASELPDPSTDYPDTFTKSHRTVSALRGSSLKVLSQPTLSPKELGPSGLPGSPKQGCPEGSEQDEEQETFPLCALMPAQRDQSACPGPRVDVLPPSSLIPELPAPYPSLLVRLGLSTDSLELIVGSLLSDGHFFPSSVAWKPHPLPEYSGSGICPEIPACGEFPALLGEDSQTQPSPALRPSCAIHVPS